MQLVIWESAKLSLYLDGHGKQNFFVSLMFQGFVFLWRPYWENPPLYYTKNIRLLAMYNLNIFPVPPFSKGCKVKDLYQKRNNCASFHKKIATWPDVQKVTWGCCYISEQYHKKNSGRQIQNLSFEKMSYPIDHLHTFTFIWIGFSPDVISNVMHHFRSC